MDTAWLEEHGYASNLRSYYVRNGWLEQPARGAYLRKRGRPGWQQFVISLQTILNYSLLIVGGSNALSLQGFAHYVSQDLREVHLYGPKAPPSWVEKLGLEQAFVYDKSCRLFRNDTIIFGLIIS